MLWSVWLKSTLTIVCNISLSFGIVIRLCIVINTQRLAFYLYFGRTSFRDYPNHILAKDVSGLSIGKMDIKRT